MSLAAHARRMAEYNEWMNAKLYEAAGKLSAEALAADRNAFFGSILGTFNHLVVADRIWLQRFATHPRAPALLDPVRDLPAPAALDQVPFADLVSLAEHRRWLDAIIRQWAAALSEDDLQQVLAYRNTKGVAMRKRFSGLVFHFFNHQTHHRGQATTLLFQAGQDVGVTDLLALIADEPGP